MVIYDNIKIVENDDDLFSKELGFNLHKYNQENCEFIKQNSDDKHNNKIIFNFAVYESDNLIGGASGWIQFGWYYLDQLWISNKYRKKGIGSKIINAIEEKAKKHKCIGIKAETWSFQAREFYEKKGFEVYAELDDFPPNATEYYLKKKLDLEK